MIVAPKTVINDNISEGQEMKNGKSDVRIEIEELTKQYIKSGGAITKYEPYKKSNETNLIGKKYKRKEKINSDNEETNKKKK
jgi:hypothetical protein